MWQCWQQLTVCAGAAPSLGATGSDSACLQLTCVCDHDHDALRAVKANMAAVQACPIAILEVHGRACNLIAATAAVLVVMHSISKCCRAEQRRTPGTVSICMHAAELIAVTASIITLSTVRPMARAPVANRSFCVLSMACCRTVLMSTMHGFTCNVPSLVCSGIKVFVAAACSGRNR